MRAREPTVVPDRPGKACGALTAVALALWAGVAPAAGGHGLSPDQVALRTHALMWGGAAAVGLYGATTWWKAGVEGRFRTADEGWFAQDTYAGGADKLGHLYSAYIGTRLLTRGYQWAGNDRRRSLGLAAATTLGTLMAVELMDGFSREYRFSIQDAAMNASGVAMGLLLERYPRLDEKVGFRLRYRPSGGAGFDPVDNYSGQTYLLVVKAAGFPALRRNRVLRYLELAVGYGSRGYESTDPAGHSRHLYYGVSLNLSQVLNDTVFRGRRRGTAIQRVTDTALKFVQVPGTAALADHRFSR
ncbi:MAG TPA: DUF2279 domain-containing protein [Gammaproteobacteria bacterium]|nr:DUF2279 domain-containing protein [Gammaproteobacteria bacterium]